MNPKPKRLRFSYTDDLCFLREVVTENPFKDPNAWEIVQKNLEITSGKVFSVKTLKNHLEILLELFLKKDEVDKIRSGVEEPYCEKDHLLQEVAIISSEYKESKSRKRQVSKEKQLSDLGKKASSIFIVKDDNEIQINENIEENIYSLDALELPIEQEEIVPYDDHCYGQPGNVEKSHTLELVESTLDSTVCPEIKDASSSKVKRNVKGPNRARPRQEATLRKNSLMYLREKHEADREIRERELDLQNKQIELENRKMALEEEKLKFEIKRLEVETKEKEEKLKMEKHKWSMEMDEKKVTSQLILAQQTIINNFIKDMHDAACKNPSTKSATEKQIEGSIQKYIKSVKERVRKTTSNERTLKSRVFSSSSDEEMRMNELLSIHPDY